MITAVLGQGGFGITYRAADSVLRRDVAVKEYFPSGLGCGRQGSAVVPPARGSPTELLYLDGKAKFLEEAQLLAGFSQNPSIPDVYDVFEENATAYMVMEFISGQALSDLLTKRGRLPEAEVLTYAEKIGMVLEDLHQAHLLHRDLKPDNIIVTGDGRVVVLDFGAARQFTLGQTKAMTAILTPGYAPPEQMSGRGQFGPQTDIYAFAATLYHLLTGQPPVPATDRVMELLNGRPDPLLRPRALNRGLSTKVEDAILQGLEIEADKRPQTANAFLQAISTSTQAPLIPRQAIAPSYPTKKTRPLLMGLAVVAVLVTFLVIPRFVGQRNTSPARTAVVESVVGYLTVDSAPAGAEVFVDGRPIGRTKLEEYQLDPGTYTIRIQHSGYQQIHRQFTIQRGQRTYLNVVLAPFPQTGDDTASDRSVITGLVEDWRKAWESFDLDRYMSFYDTSFYAPYKKMNYTQWREYKAGLYSKYSVIGVQIHNLQIEVSLNSATAAFDQVYRSDKYQDYGRKTLKLRKVGDVWKIIQEDFVLYRQ